MIVAGVALIWADVTNAAETVIDIVPMDEISGPGARLVEVGKALGWELGGYLAVRNSDSA